MRKQKYIVPAIVCVNVASQGEMCGQPVYFSTLGPGVAGAKVGSVEDFVDDTAFEASFDHNPGDTSGSGKWDD